MCARRFENSSAIWIASSRVGQSTIACTTRFVGSIFSMMGNPERGSLAEYPARCLGSYIAPGLDERNGECLDGGGLFKAHIFNRLSDFL